MTSKEKIKLSKKICSKCGQELSIDNFYQTKNGWIDSMCKKCTSQQRRDRYNKTGKKENRIYYDKSKDRLVEHNGLSTSILWTPAMKSYLIENFPTTINKKLAETLGVPLRTMARKANELGLKKDPVWYTKEYKQSVKHPVVAVNPDGQVAGCFDTITNAAKACGAGKSAISWSCRKGSICKGLRWYYEEDFRKIYEEQRIDELKFTLNPNLDIKTGHFRKGHKLNVGRKYKATIGKESRSDFYREICRRLLNDPNSNFGPNRKGLPSKSKKVICVDSGETFPSVAECSRQTGLTLSALYASIKRMTRCGGRKYMYYSVYEEINKKVNAQAVI